MIEELVSCRCRPLETRGAPSGCGKHALIPDSDQICHCRGGHWSIECIARRLVEEDASLRQIADAAKNLVNRPEAV